MFWQWLYIVHLASSIPLMFLAEHADNTGHNIDKIAGLGFIAFGSIAIFLKFKMDMEKDTDLEKIYHRIHVMFIACIGIGIYLLLQSS